MTYKPTRSQIENPNSFVHSGFYHEGIALLPYPIEGLSEGVVERVGPDFDRFVYDLYFELFTAETRFTEPIQWYIFQERIDNSFYQIIDEENTLLMDEFSKTNRFIVNDDDSSNWKISRQLAYLGHYSQIENVVKRYLLTASRFEVKGFKYASLFFKRLAYLHALDAAEMYADDEYKIDRLNTLVDDRLELVIEAEEKKIYTQLRGMDDEFEGILW